uniref:Uncharacterized protein n=1 Tax=Pseudictyota dubia TaxID=2749911 RepID=A0A7R9VU08_9STRA|mmetsp:Transcript_23073/g.42786  ORF Transcript_23073/g.42786 Transcript_23073/m.42786 type:complete len:187 (+) Transcript_23073:169-729(+)|eukprot:CAMPEP_0197459736 /NCGR_PEP_ID=MMETSP1175-20131217/52240_1 /TAXON_ID=1003142 /ORGANISM="Triceratium dubium, Strain CCMP147" /LENGTH=186 /DNA_ID=CAMNT_0042994695 /DNA_START=137 /DNA_END=697 /DNA_ORIENTATION=-
MKLLATPTIVVLLTSLVSSFESVVALSNDNTPNHEMLRGAIGKDKLGGLSRKLNAQAPAPDSYIIANGTAMYQPASSQPQQTLSFGMVMPARVDGTNIAPVAASVSAYLISQAGLQQFTAYPENSTLNQNMQVTLVHENGSRKKVTLEPAPTAPDGNRALTECSCVGSDDSGTIRYVLVEVVDIDE